MSKHSEVEEIWQVRDKVFWQKVQKQADGCWVWLGKGTRFAHRGFGTARQVAWFLHYGVRPLGILRRVCRYDLCVNPEHHTEEQNHLSHPRE